MSLLKLMTRVGLVRVPPPSEQMVVRIGDEALGLSNILTRSDKDLGGFSTVELTPTQEGPAQFARFKGDLSLDLPADRPDIVRLGYAMWRTKDIEPKLFGLASNEYLNWEPYNHMLLRVRGDRRKYFINVQAESAYPTDLFQHRLFLKTPGSWETVVVPLSNFILTNGGVIQQQQPMSLTEVKSVGIGLIDRQYGPYQLDIEWIKVIAGEAPTKPANDHLTPGKRLSVEE